MKRRYRIAIYMVDRTRTQIVYESKLLKYKWLAKLGAWLIVADMSLTTPMESISFRSEIITQ